MYTNTQTHSQTYFQIKRHDTPEKKTQAHTHKYTSKHTYIYIYIYLHNYIYIYYCKVETNE